MTDKLIATTNVLYKFVLFYTAVSLAILRGKNESYDQAVKTEDLSKDEDQDHADEKFRLLCCSSDTGIANNSDSIASCQS